MPSITFTGSQFLRIIGLGAFQEIAESTSNGISLDSTGASGAIRIANCKVGGGLKLNSAAGAMIKNCNTLAVEMQGSGSSSQHFQETVIGKTITNTNAPSRLFFEDCIIDTTSFSTHSIVCTNDTTAPDRLFFKDTIILTNSSFNAVHKTSSNTSITLDFIGGSTGMAYFGNPSDFTINGNYICQTNINSTPYLAQIS